jgi:hypothetical protein
VLNEAKNIMETAEAREDWAYLAPAKIVYAWSFSMATDVWGPVPHAEALDPLVRKPAYDNQQAVYESVVRLLDEAIDELQRPVFPTRVPRVNDLVYGGEQYKWLRLAHVLKAQALMRPAYAAGQSAQNRATQALAALENGFTGNLDDADFRYPNNTAGRDMHPWSVARLVAGYRVSQYYVTLLQARSDPRLNITANAASGNVRRGHKNGDPQGPDASYSAVANYFANDTLWSWKSYAEAKFLEAEARLIVSGAAAADAAYRDGIRANMQKMRVSASAINTYINARPNLGTVANPLEEIMREKYIANYLKYEAWADWRRTTYPQLTPVTGALTNGIPQRFPWPATELSVNGENVQATGIAAGLAGMSTPVWWATR